MSLGDGAGGRGLILAGLSGLVLALAYPGPDLNLLAFVALIPLLLALQEAPRRAAWARGYAFGLAFYLPLLRWLGRVMVTYGGLPRPVAVLSLLLLVLYLSTYAALFAAAVGGLTRRFGPVALSVAPVLWTGLEIVRGHLLGGFPWGLLGYSQYRNLPLLQVASLGGIYAVSFLVLGVNAALALLLIRPSPRGSIPAAAGLILLMAAALAWGSAALRAEDARSSAPTLKVAAIQGNVTQNRKWRPGEEQEILRVLVQLTRSAAEQGARLVVWPESATPFSFRRPVRGHDGGGRPVVELDREYLDRVSGLARDLDIALIAGSVDYRFAKGRLRAFNSAFTVAPDGTLGPSYDKVHLVPFGEYVPLGRVLFFVDRMVQGAIADFAPGDRLVPLPTPAGAAGTFICYEAIFPDLVRRLGRRASFLVNITNDAWFARSAAPQQHLAMAAVRAVENRRYLIRAANTGISAIVSPSGRILGRTGLDETAVLPGLIVPRDTLTPYARGGDRFAWGCAILSLLLIAASRATPGRPAA